jgi:4-amino-4-deoxy-L-arabinose transferase-like glycosyltransferase
LFAIALAVGAGPRPAAAGVLVFVSAVAVGDLLVKRISRIGAQPLLAVAVSAMVGLAIIAAAVGILAHFPVNYLWVYLPLLVLPIAVSPGRLRHHAMVAYHWLKQGSDESASSFWAGGLMLAVIALHIVRVVQPGVDWDGLGMHEMVASTMAFHGQWNFDFHANTMALWPMAADWLLSVGWILGGEVAARLVNFVGFLLVCAMLQALMARLTGRGASRILIAVFASSSLAFGLTQNTFTEMTLTAFALGAFAVIVSVGDDLRWPLPAAAGILLGGCLLSKASAVFIVVPLAVLLAVVCWRKKGPIWGTAVLGVAAALAVAVSVSAYLYAYVRTGNPVFPLYNGVFHSPYAPAETVLDTRWTGHFSWLLPYKMTFATASYMEGYDGGLGFQYLIFFPAGLAAAVLARTRSALLAAAVATASGLLFLVSVQYARYVFPALALAMIVCAAALLKPTTLGTATRKWAVVVALAVVPLNLYFMPAGVYGWAGFRLDGLWSRSARHALVDQLAPWWVLNGIVNEQAGRSARVAYLGRMAGAGLEGTPVYAVGWNPSFYAAVTAAKTSDQVMAALRAENVGYAITDPLAGPGTPGDLPVVRAALADHATVIATVGGATLYRLASDGP